MGAHKGHKRVRSPGAGLTNNCEPSCRCWEPMLGPLEKQLVLLTAKLKS